MLIGSHCKLSHVDKNFSVKALQKYLGVHIDESLRWLWALTYESYYKEHICWSCSFETHASAPSYHLIQELVCTCNVFK